MTFNKKLQDHGRAVNDLLQEVLADFPSGIPSSFRLGNAMRYGALDGGKRFRPFLVIECASLFGVRPSDALYAAAAVECIHCYSLIHDDLPAMDDDDMRRGRPTVHIQFDEAAAILAGDALQSLAFELLAAPETHSDSAVRADLIGSLARAAGWHGMAGGQDLDLTAAERTLTREQIETLQSMKTGALIEWSCEAGGRLGSARASELKALRQYAHCLGLSFQIADDLLDLEGDAAVVGKEVGKDKEAGKATLSRQLGAEGAKALLLDLENQAIASVAPFGANADMLKEAARFAARRKH